MARRPNIIPSVELSLKLPLDVRTKLDLHLYSELEGRVPKGRYQEFFVDRIREFFEREVLDMAPYVRDLPSGAALVSGPPEAITILKRILEQ